jgi:ribosomal protein S18 acetylase RimI-like enzyme
VTGVDHDALRFAIASGATRIEITALKPAGIDEIAWSGGRPHLESVATQLQRVDTGEVEYLLVRADGYAVSKGGIDFANELDAGTIWQLATHPQLEGLGLAMRLIHELESRAHERDVNRLRLAVEHNNTRARRLYDHLGYRAMGESEASWEAEATDGSPFLYTTKLTEMVKVVPFPYAAGASSARDR